MRVSFLYRKANSLTIQTATTSYQLAHTAWASSLRGNSQTFQLPLNVSMARASLVALIFQSRLLSFAALSLIWPLSSVWCSSTGRRRAQRQRRNNISRQNSWCWTSLHWKWGTFLKRTLTGSSDDLSVTWKGWWKDRLRSRRNFGGRLFRSGCRITESFFKLLKRSRRFTKSCTSWLASTLLTRGETWRHLRTWTTS